MCLSNRPLGLADSETHTYQNPRLSLYKNVRLCCSNLLELSKFMIGKVTILKRGMPPCIYVHLCMCVLCMCVGRMSVWMACLSVKATSTSVGFPSHFSAFVLRSDPSLNLEFTNQRAAPGSEYLRPSLSFASPSAVPGFLCGCLGSGLTSL